MSSTVNRAYTLLATGSASGTWGPTENSNLDVIDDNFGGRLSVSVAGSSNYTVSSSQGANIFHTLTGILTGNIEYILPTQGAIYCINNATTGAYTVTAIMSSGTGIIIPQGSTMMVFANPDTPAVTPAFGANVIVDEQIYTATGTATWDMPLGLGANAMTFVQVWGAGGSGGSGAYSAGGGGGGYKEAWFLTSSLTSTVTVTVGAGGALVNGTNISGNNGASSSFGSYLIGYGGAKGSAGATSSGGGGGGGWFANTTGAAPDAPTGEGHGALGSTSTAGTIGSIVGGGGGASSSAPYAVAGYSSIFGGGGGGAGGSSGSAESGGISMYGGAGGAGTTSGAATAGTQPGGGGGGSASGANSGAGGAGKVIVTTYNG